jgi:uncharacterized membrane protein
MTEAIHNFFIGFPDWLHVMLISAIPVIELRGSIPYGILYLQMPYWSAMIYGIIGSIIPAPFIVYLGEAVLTALERSRIRGISRFAVKFRESRLRKSDKIRKYSYWGVLLFVAIPLPGTGVWTGCLIAALLKLDPIKAICAAFAGTAIAGVIVTLLVQGGVWLTTV